MKTSKFLMIVTVVAIGLMSFSFIEREEAPAQKKTQVHLTLMEAMQVSGLVSTMYEQLNDDFLLAHQDINYVQSVYFQGATWFISGTYAQWTQFFRVKVKYLSFDRDID